MDQAMGGYSVNRRKFLFGLTAAGLYVSTVGIQKSVAMVADECRDPRLITGELKSWRSNPRLLRLEPAFRFLERPDLKDLPAGRVEIDGDRMYGLVMKTPTRAIQSAQFEAHRKYMDIHYYISGQDITGSYPSEELTVAVPYDEKSDIELFAIPPKYLKLNMSPGKFAIFLSGGGHMPNCHEEKPDNLNKLVVKVQRDFGIVK